MSCVRPCCCSSKCVAIRAFGNPYGSILRVQTVGFQEYCSDVLPNEWMPSWDPASLRAGAMAVRMFAWYHHLHPVTVGGFTFDVDNTANFQVFRYQSGTPATDQAVQTVWPYACALPGGGIAPLDYRAGWRNTANWPLARSQKVSQWGSEYLANSGRSYLQILGFYFPGRAWLRVP